MQTTLIKVGEGYELRTTNRAIGDELALLAKATPFIIAGASYKRQRLSTGRTRQGYSGFFTFEPHEFVQGAADMVVCLDGLLECSAPTVELLDLSNPPSGATHYNPRDRRHPFRKRLGDLCFTWRSDDSSWVQLKNKPNQCQWEPLCPQWIGRIQRQTFSAENPQHQQIPKAARPIIKRQRTIEDYIACNWPRSVYNGVGPNCRCTHVPVEPAQWDGEGLPPVGVDCEVLRSSVLGLYDTCHVMAHDNGLAVFRYISGESKGEYAADGLRTSLQLPSFRPIKTAEQLAAEQREAAVQRVCDRFALFGDEVAVDWKALFGQMYDYGMRFPEEK